jgi:hypothetical protein
MSGLVLIFSDVLPADFPYDSSTAQAVTTTHGSTFAKDVISNRGIMVVPKSDNQDGTSYNSFYYSNSSGNVNEFARQSVAVDSTSEYGSIGFQTLKTLNGTKTIESVMEMNHQEVSINSTSATDAALESTTKVDYNGITFSKDDSAIYLGADANIRLKFTPGGAPDGKNVFEIGAKQTDGSYLTAFSTTQG